MDQAGGIVGAIRHYQDMKWLAEGAPECIGRDALLPCSFFHPQRLADVVGIGVGPGDETAHF